LLETGIQELQWRLQEYRGTPTGHSLEQRCFTPAASPFLLAAEFQVLLFKYGSTQGIPTAHSLEQRLFTSAAAIFSSTAECLVAVCCGMLQVCCSVLLCITSWL